MPAGRPEKEKARNIVVRMPESLYAELILLRPELLSPRGTRYGAITSYFTSLVRKDLEEIKHEIRKSGASLAEA